MALQVRRILETCLYVDDLQLAKQFYQQVLGLQLYSEQAERHVFFRCGDQMLLLFRPQACLQEGDFPPHGALGPGHVAFAVSDDELDAWEQRLRELGVEIERRWEPRGGGRSLYFRDPQGNSLEIATPDLWD